MTAPVPASADNPSATAGPDADNAALRADIRRLGDLLGETLVRQEGPELLGLVEQVRLLSRTDGEATAELLAGIDLETAGKLVRAFSTYFHLANVTEQVHRGREFATRRAREGSLLAQTADQLAEADPKHLQDTLAHLAVRPVFTAHPTEAARRSVLNKLRRIGELLERIHREHIASGLSEADPVRHSSAKRQASIRMATHEESMSARSSMWMAIDAGCSLARVRSWLRNWPAEPRSIAPMTSMSTSPS